VYVLSVLIYHILLAWRAQHSGQGEGAFSMISNGTGQGRSEIIKHYIIPRDFLREKVPRETTPVSN
jgi:hypothetical protein